MLLHAGAAETVAAVQVSKVSSHLLLSADLTAVDSLQETTVYANIWLWLVSLNYGGPALTWVRRRQVTSADYVSESIPCGLFIAGAGCEEPHHG